MATKTEIRRTIKIKESTYFALKKQGMMGESFDDVIRRIMKLHEKEKKMAKTTKKDEEVASKMG